MCSDEKEGLIHTISFAGVRACSSPNTKALHQGVFGLNRHDCWEFILRLETTNHARCSRVKAQFPKRPTAKIRWKTSCNELMKLNHHWWNASLPRVQKDKQNSLRYSHPTYWKPRNAEGQTFFEILHPPRATATWHSSFWLQEGTNELVGKWRVVLF